jgi:hypothetical protein
MPPLAKVPLGPEAGAVKVTLTPESGLLPESSTTACSATGNAVCTAADCPLPADTAIEAGTPVLVSEKTTALVRAVALALTLNAPLVEFAVNTGAVATPFEFVVTDTLEAAPGKVPLAPWVGAVNFTETFGTGFEPASRTNTCKGAKAVRTAVDWPLPALAEAEATGPGLLVREKTAELDTPTTVALTA